MITVSDKSIKDNSIHVFLVMEMILSGLKKLEIIENINKNESLKWEYNEAEIEDIIEKANLEIIDIMDLDKETLLANLFAKYDFIYKKLVNVKDYKGALMALDKIVNLTNAGKNE